METLASLDSDHVALTCQRGEHDVGAIGFKNLANLVQTSEQDTVNFGGRNSDIFDVEPDPLNSFVKLLLGKLNGLRTLAGDKDVSRVATAGLGRAVAIHLREWRRKVDRSTGGRLDELYVLAMTATDKLMA